ncbi:UNVERIFIED_CONTAM: hypothetical protein PYX00_005898 [Menopon gallinae]|uniref:Gustatory receptor n=1 Tax=Menopon gallinae TaxID=328185 RepID=A0AAW2HT00_9NEOP
MKANGVYRILYASFTLQYASLSFPPCFIRSNGSVVTKKNVARIELFLSAVAAVAEVISLIFLYKYTSQPSLYNIIMVVWNFSCAVSSVLSACEVLTKLGVMKNALEEIRILSSVVRLRKEQLARLKYKIVVWIVALPTLMISVSVFILAAGYPLHIAMLLYFTNTKLYLQPMFVQVQFLALMTVVQYYMEMVNAKLTGMHFAGQSALVCKSHGNIRYGRTDDRRMEFECEVADEVEKVRKFYERIHDLKTAVNEAFTLRLWLDTLQGMINTITFVYFGMIHSRQLKNFEDNYMIKVDVCFLLYQAVLFTVLFLQKVMICDRVSQNARTVGVNVHRIFSRFHCERVRQELTTFSLELLHRDPSVRGNNFFTIDYRLIFEVTYPNGRPARLRCNAFSFFQLLNGIIMLLIALLQFQFAGTDEEADVMNDYIWTR